MKRGRPKKQNKKDVVIQLRIDKDTKEKLEKKLENDIKFESISQFLRYKIREYING